MTPLSTLSASKRTEEEARRQRRATQITDTRRHLKCALMHLDDGVPDQRLRAAHDFVLSANDLLAQLCLDATGRELEAMGEG